MVATEINPNTDFRNRGGQSPLNRDFLREAFGLPSEPSSSRRLRRQHRRFPELRRDAFPTIPETPQIPALPANEHANPSPLAGLPAIALQSTPLATATEPKSVEEFVTDAVTSHIHGDPFASELYRMDRCMEACRAVALMAYCAASPEDRFQLAFHADLNARDDFEPIALSVRVVLDEVVLVDRSRGTAGHIAAVLMEQARKLTQLANEITEGTVAQ